MTKLPQLNKYLGFWGGFIVYFAFFTYLFLNQKISETGYYMFSVTGFLISWFLTNTDKVGEVVFGKFGLKLRKAEDNIKKLAGIISYLSAISTGSGVQRHHLMEMLRGLLKDTGYTNSETDRILEDGLLMEKFMSSEKGITEAEKKDLEQRELI